MSYKLVNISDAMMELALDLDNRDGDLKLQLKSLPKLNFLLGGIKKRKLTIIGGRTSQGKSSLAVQVCHDLATQGFYVVYLSLEMENLEIAERVMSYSLEINNNKFIWGDKNELVKKSIKLSEKLKPLRWFVSDCIGKTWKEIDNMLTEITKNFQEIPDVIMLDYIQNTKGEGNQKEVYDEYIRRFREMAIRHNFSAILCSQLNRTNPEAKDKTPQLHQLKGTGFLEEHADAVILLHWPYFYDRDKDMNYFELFLSKNKQGPTGMISARYNPECYMFSEPESLKKQVEPEVKWDE